MKRSTPRPPHPAAGFTLVELVMVITLIGTLAVFVMPRALDLSDWRLRAFADELQAQAAAMQRLALVQRRPVVATLDGSGVGFAYAAGGEIVRIDCPPATTPCIAETATRTVTFNAQNAGRVVTSSGSALPVTISHGGSSRSYRFEAETGLFRPAP